MAASKEVVAAGFVIFRKIKEEIQYLLLQSSYGDYHWTPPKGHVESGETEMQTAYRETQEEAGLTNDKLKVIEECKKTLYYNVNGKPKRVVYWLSELKDPNFPITLSEESINYQWLQIEDACKTSSFSDMQKALREMDAFVTTQK